jgi:hypothetical protein
MKATPMAPAFYVLTLAAVGLLLGVYLQRDLDADSQVSADSEARDRSPVEV